MRHVTDRSHTRVERERCAHARRQRGTANGDDENSGRALDKFKYRFMKHNSTNTHCLYFDIDKYRIDHTSDATSGRR